MSNKYYTSDHEWLLIEGDVATIGITDYAQQSLGDVVYVELPEVDSDCDKGESFATVESVKAASDVYAPVSGKVIAINETLEDEPEAVNEHAEDSAWFVKIQLQDAPDTSEWMDRDAYLATIEE